MLTALSPKSSLKLTVTSDPRDWSINPSDAWIYGIVCGWGPLLPEICRRHGWPEQLLADLHTAWELQ